MKKIIDFIKENSGIVGKLLINHIAMSIFGIIVLVTASGIAKWLFYTAAVVSILMYMFLIYMVMWEAGSKDKVRVDGGRIKANKLYGLYVSLIYNSLFILIAIVIFILSFFTTQGSITAVNNVYGMLKIISHYLMGMYLGVTSRLPYDFIYLIIIVPSILCSTLSYLSGLSGMKCLFPDKKKKK